METLREIDESKTLTDLKKLLKNTFLMSIGLMCLAAYLVKSAISSWDGFDSGIVLVVGVGVAIWGFVIFCMHTNLGPADISSIQNQLASLKIANQDLKDRINNKDQ